MIFSTLVASVRLRKEVAAGQVSSTLSIGTSTLLIAGIIAFVSHLGFLHCIMDLLSDKAWALKSLGI
jgi:hypothetical protein